MCAEQTLCTTYVIPTTPTHTELIKFIPLCCRPPSIFLAGVLFFRLFQKALWNGVALDAALSTHLCHVYRCLGLKNLARINSVKWKENSTWNNTRPLNIRITCFALIWVMRLESCVQCVHHSVNAVRHLLVALYYLIITHAYTLVLASRHSIKLRPSDGFIRAFYSFFRQTKKKLLDLRAYIAVSHSIFPPFISHPLLQELSSFPTPIRSMTECLYILPSYEQLFVSRARVCVCMSMRKMLVSIARKARSLCKKWKF